MVLTYSDWMKWYNWITTLLGIDPSGDELATTILSDIVGEYYVKPSELRDLISDRVLVVFGAGPSLKDHVKLVKKHLYTRSSDRVVLVSADGATRALLEEGLVPDIVVTDLDGGYDVLYEAGSRGSILVVHGHGDNIDKIREYVPVFLNNGFKIHATTQVKPLWNVFNYGGFTDGDRAVYLALNYNPQRIVLAGMDLGYRIGVYSGKNFNTKPSRLASKLLKLHIATRLLEEASMRSKTPIFSLSQNMVKGVVYVDEKHLPLLIP